MNNAKRKKKRVLRYSWVDRDLLCNWVIPASNAMTWRDIVALKFWEVVIFFRSRFIGCRSFDEWRDNQPPFWSKEMPSPVTIL